MANLTITTNHTVNRPSMMAFISTPDLNTFTVKVCTAIPGTEVEITLQDTIKQKEGNTEEEVKDFKEEMTTDTIDGRI